MIVWSSEGIRSTLTDQLHPTRNRPATDLRSTSWICWVAYTISVIRNNENTCTAADNTHYSLLPCMCVWMAFIAWMVTINKLIEVCSVCVQLHAGLFVDWVTYAHAPWHFIGEFACMYSTPQTPCSICVRMYACIATCLFHIHTTSGLWLDVVVLWPPETATSVHTWRCTMSCQLATKACV